LHAQLRHEALFIHLILNAYWEPLEFELPRLEAGPWRRWIDTALDSPDDIVPWESAPPVATGAYPAEARSVVMLFAGSAVT
jgi:glycogen operon protein